MATSRLCMAINLSNGSVSQYQGYDFNSFARVNDTCLAANEDGLYTLDDASTDVGGVIPWWLQSKKLNFGEIYTTWFLKSYLTYRATNDLEITLTPDGSDGETFTFTNTDIDGNWHTDYTSVNRSIRGDFWTIKIGNLSDVGTDVSLRSCWLFGPSRKPKMVFSGISGLNTKLDPALIAYDSQTGVQEMSEVVNLWIDDSLCAHRRKGYSLKQTGSFHSLYSDGSRVYVIGERTNDAALYYIGSYPVCGLTGLRSGLTKWKRMSYATVAGKTFYSNDVENGYIDDGATFSWTGTQPDSADPVNRLDYVSVQAPIGHLVAKLGSHILVAMGSVLYASVPGAPFWWQLGKDFRVFDSDITALCPVEDGLWVGTAEAVYYLAGLQPINAPVMRKTSYGFIEGTECRVLGSIVGQGVPGICWVVTAGSGKGICILGPQGFFMNMTEKKLSYPISVHGAGVVVDNNRYIVTLEP